MSADISATDLLLILCILNEHLKDLGAEIYAFGSRVKGMSKKYSDLDLAIDCNGKKLPLKTEIELSLAFENSLIPYKVDIVDINTISKEFKNNIQSDLVKLAEILPKDKN